MHMHFAPGQSRPWRTAAAAAAVLVSLVLSPRGAGAQTFLTETFSNAPDSVVRNGQTGAVPGTGLTMTNGISEIVNDPTPSSRGKYLWMRLGWYALSSDANGYAAATVQSTRRFDLFAGATYILQFDWTRQGFSAGNGPFPFSFTAQLGSSSMTLSDNAGFFRGENWQTATLTFTPQTTELGAILQFAGNGSGYTGFYLDNISMVGIAPPSVPGEPGVVPEPSTWALLVTGLGMLALMSRRRRPVAIR